MLTIIQNPALDMATYQRKIEGSGKASGGRFHRKGVRSTVCLPQATSLSVVDALCLGCFVEPLLDKSDDNSRNQLQFEACDFESSKGLSKFLLHIRAARNFYEQNVDLQLEDKRSGDTSSHIFSCCHGKSKIVGPIRFIVSKCIAPDEELLAWPNLHLVLTANLAILTLLHIKGPSCYQCNICDRQFGNPNQLKTHIYLKDCGRESCEKITLNNTAKEDVIGSEPHICGFCGKSYDRRYSLTIHERTHTGLKPLSCRICSRRFSDPSNLNKHLRIHANNSKSLDGSPIKLSFNPYVCKLCGNTSIRRRDLERHMQKRH